MGVINYYNEFEPYAAKWLRNLISEGLIPEGEVDERSIEEVKGKDLEGYTQCHLFAGIGGWPYALELAGWGAGRPVWTGSCPCQPFSAAGKRMGTEDERHLWPDFARLIAECNPSTIFGEQVASKDGREWLSGVRTDLESLGYGVGAADLCAAGIGAPHIRQRLWWVADAERGTSKRYGHEMAGTSSSHQSREKERERVRFDAGDGGEFGWLADAQGGREHQRFEGERQAESSGASEGGGMRNAADTGLEGATRTSLQRRSDGSSWDGELIPCLDGKARRIEPGICPLAHGVPRRVGALKAYGNAIVPQVAAEFIRAFMEITPTQGD